MRTNKPLAPVEHQPAESRPRRPDYIRVAKRHASVPGRLPFVPWTWQNPGRGPIAATSGPVAASGHLDSSRRRRVIHTTFLPGDFNMSLTNATLLLASIGFLGVDDAKKNDADAIKGKWVAVSINFRGADVPAALARSFKFDFDGKKYVNSEGERSEEGGYTIDTSKSPRTIDFDIKTGMDQGKKQLGIYKIDGGKLTIAAAMAGSTERPKSFEPEAGSQVLIVVLEKEKP
jgi:uncharacterized protein (TIGR03067 family)